ncbi:DEAD/DEAH box helicase domain protein [Parvibaculum lavamentivorans DS-1]|uniref:DEAD-box ATP-dependent RNA helicase RhpA n=1 Tax=Parvibaculum lavamentivorans (strain DS-1 / DSM 13023 / NCIMB 13966) TaxID=402881 RepID=A7HW11_PARL1|nr:DEAD/DEAH box helicase [Parvibaculum lavamentivorans]ABS64094.1 DEAD/DEAH box helicase domain protein [Parvibaculum lavamentivorans DS-1]
MTTVTFADLGVAEPLCRALAANNYTNPTPIQAQAIPALLEGRDLLGLAQTGTGKTAAFALPILQILAAANEKRQPKEARALILAPTRELAVQISQSIESYGKNFKLRHTVIFGGVNQFRQVKAMTAGVDIVVATPGRLLDLMNQKHVNLSRTSLLVLDEADRMLDMGFIRDVRKIIAAMPRQRQSLLFSATMPSSIQHLADEILREPVRVEVTPEVVTVDKIDQRVLHVDGKRKRELLAKLLDNSELSRVIVFTRTKHCANRVSEQLDKSGVLSEAIHGNKSQGARQRALDMFRNGKARVLVATDIAARGIDVSDITHVINYELPNEPESYVHRIGRTARAGKSGIALSFCDASERSHLRSIEKLTKRPLTVMDTTEWLGEQVAVPAGEPMAKRAGNRNGGGPRNGNSNRQPGKPRRFGGKPGGGAGNRGQKPGQKGGQQSRRQSTAS